MSSAAALCRHPRRGHGRVDDRKPAAAAMGGAGHQDHADRIQRDRNHRRRRRLDSAAEGLFRQARHRRSRMDAALQCDLQSRDRVRRLVRPAGLSSAISIPSRPTSMASPQGQFFYSTLARRGGRDVPAHPDPFFLQTRIAREGLAPMAPENFPFFVSYGYHFDAHLIGALPARLGDCAQASNMSMRTSRSVELNDAGDVAALIAEDGRRFEADFFVDASGFRAAIIETRWASRIARSPRICSTTARWSRRLRSPADGTDACTARPPSRPAGSGKSRLPTASAMATSIRRATSTATPPPPSFARTSASPRTPRFATCK